MAFEIKPATRTGVIPLIGIYGESGTGKTMSALLLARGLAGPAGRVVMVDSETRRGSLYADVIPGGYEVIDLDGPFSPARYIEAIQTAFDAKPAAVVIDSMSHEHEGPGGVLDMAAENESRSGRAGLHNWKTPKFEHAKLVQFLLRAPVPVICCIRAKYKTRQTKENGKTAIVKDEVTSPIQAEDFIFEMTAHFEVLPNHSIVLSKVNHPELRKCFPENGMIGIEHGQQIAAWCNNATKPAPPQPSTAAKSLKERLWKMTATKHLDDPKRLQQMLWDEGLIDLTEKLSELSEVRLAQVIKKLEAK